VNLDEIFRKTELGTTELVERRLKLTIDMRRLLILVDGKHTVAQILARGQAFHADAGSIAELERAGLIERLFTARSSEQVETGPIVRSEVEVTRFLDAQKALSDAINEHLGFRGYLMMMRLQKAENLRDLHEMLPDFAQALVKRKGIEGATPSGSAREQMVVRKS
jgi:hypothetical protein